MRGTGVSFRRGIDISFWLLAVVRLLAVPDTASIVDLGYGATNNNGNLLTQNIAARKGDGSYLALQQTYAYDALNRLTTFSEANGVSVWGQTNQYDRYGNRWATTTAGVSQAAMTPTVPEWINAAKNRIEGSQAGPLVYDAAGNITTHPQLGTMAYDAENRLTNFGAVSTYAYDGEGRRVKRQVGATITYYVYDGDGVLAAEYGGTSSIVGQRYLSVDHLGTTRLTTDGLAKVKSRCDYLPFGDQILAVAAQGGRDQIPEYGCGEADITLKFTGKERDAETGLDYFGARYMSAAQGRFTSPDEWAGGIVDAFTGAEISQPGPLPYADITDPQTINKYAYVRNNPLRYTDPTGHCPWCIGALTSVVTGGVIRAVTGQPVLDAKAIAIDAATGAIGAGLAGKAARLAQLAGFAKLENAAAQARYLGAFGEEAGGAANAGKEAFRTAAGKLRYADSAAGAAEVLEVKNVAQITARNATQIADEAAHAAATGRPMVLATRATTDVTRVQGLINSGAVQQTILPNVAKDGLRQGLFRGEAAAVGAATGAGCSVPGNSCAH